MNCIKLVALLCVVGMVSSCANVGDCSSCLRDRKCMYVVNSSGGQCILKGSTGFYLQITHPKDCPKG